MSSPATQRRPHPGDVRRRVVLFVVVLLALIAGALLWWHSVYAQWVPDGQPPPRLAACGRSYNRGDHVVTAHPRPEELAASLGSHPPFVGSPIQAERGCEGSVPVVIYLQHHDGYVSYGLSGGL